MSQERSGWSCASSRLGQQDPQLKNEKSGKLTFAVLHDEDYKTLLDEVFLVRHNIGVFQLVEQFDVFHFFHKVVWVRTDLHLLSDVFLVFCFVGHKVNGPKTTLAKQLVLGVL